MLGSPRQLENAVPTNKNPHGVWVWKRKKRQTNYRCFSQQKETIILDNFWNSISFDACNTKIINWSEKIRLLLYACNAIFFPKIQKKNSI